MKKILMLAMVLGLLMSSTVVSAQVRVAVTPFEFSRSREIPKSFEPLF